MTNILYKEKLFNAKSVYISFAFFILAGFGQYLFTIQGSGQIRYEELAESIRNVYWLEHGYIYDGVSSNIGWYATLLFLYHTFGFSLFTGRLLRVFLHALSIFCLHRFLVRHLRTPFAEVLALMVALSPTLVYFNSIQTSYAMDMVYFPPLLLLGSIIIETQKKLPRSFLLFLFGLITMIGAMSYPTLLFYGPGVVLLFFLWKPARQIFSFSSLILLLSGLLLPLLLSLAYLKNPGALIYDDATRSGLFRGGGRPFINMGIWKNNMSTLAHDLLLQGNSYYFRAKSVEFGSVIAKSSAALLLLLSVFTLNNYRVYWKWLIPPLLLLLTFCMIPAFATGGSGIRRFTGVLAAFYWIIAIHFWIIQNQEKNLLQKLSLVFGIILCATHAFSCFVNGRNLSSHDDYSNQIWFKLAETPQESIALIKRKLTTDNKSITLCVKNEEGNPVQPRYAEIYAVLAGDYLWNGGKNIPIYACDLKQNKLRLLQPKDWILSK